MLLLCGFDDEGLDHVHNFPLHHLMEFLDGLMLIIDDGVDEDDED